MAYRIRYAGRFRRRSIQNWMALSWIVAGIAVVYAVLSVHPEAMWQEPAQAVFLPLTESAGEGWYEALAEACADVIHGTH